MPWTTEILSVHSNFASWLIVVPAVVSHPLRCYEPDPVSLNYKLVANVGRLNQGFIIILCRAFYNLYLHPLRKYPGPKLWAVSRLPFTHAWLSGSAHKRIQKLHRQ